MRRVRSRIGQDSGAPITFLRTARESGISPQIVALSAVIGGVNHFDTWLECKALITNERPVRLVEG
jgi:helicase